MFYFFLLISLSIAYDSGIFAMKYLDEYEFGVDISHKFDEEDIPNLRIKLVHQMIMSDKNSATDGKSKILEVVFLVIVFFIPCFLVYIFAVL
jgi:hypothetical protein